MNGESASQGRPVVVLTGFMGAGKSTVGAALADLLGVEFVDTDHEIVARAGRSIADIFAHDGELHFRDLEAQVIADVLASRRGVVALGGGAVMTAAVQEALAGHRVVFLEVSPDAGFARVRNSRRPLLSPREGGPEATGVPPEDGDPEHRYRTLLAQRTDTYRQTAELTTDTTGRAPAVLADEIARALGIAPDTVSHRDEGPQQ